MYLDDKGSCGVERGGVISPSVLMLNGFFKKVGKIVGILLGMQSKVPSARYLLTTYHIYIATVCSECMCSCVGSYTFNKYYKFNFQVEDDTVQNKKKLTWHYLE